MDGSNEVTTRGVDHVGLTVLDLETTRAFFCDCLGWEVVGGNPSYPAVFVSDGYATLTLWQVNHPQSSVKFDRKRNLGLHHLAIRVSSINELGTLFQRVAEWPGVVVEFPPELVGQGSKTHFMVTEPGGIRLEFACDPLS